MSGTSGYRSLNAIACGDETACVGGRRIEKCLHIEGGVSGQKQGAARSQGRAGKRWNGSIGGVAERRIGCGFGDGDIYGLLGGGDAGIDADDRVCGGLC